MCIVKSANTGVATSGQFREKWRPDGSIDGLIKALFR